MQKYMWAWVFEKHQVLLMEESEYLWVGLVWVCSLIPAICSR